MQMAEETECLEIVELIKRHIKTAHDPNVSVLYKQMPHNLATQLPAHIPCLI